MHGRSRFWPGLIALALVAGACSASPHREEEANPGSAYAVHLAGAWYEHRAGWLGLSRRQAEERDGKMSAEQPPDNFWDEQTATEAAMVWRSLCNDCHGGRRPIAEAASIPPPEAGWGTGEGVFFGSRRPYAEIFSVIASGGPPQGDKKSDMPPWKGPLSNEMIWSMVYFLEVFSGGTEGPLPPALPPRRTTDL